ncbi:hypothetical protein DWV91_00510 [Enterococcus asini]|nr:hypothetical protein DWV91_00510 [Enterococcus asini]
MRLGSFCNFSTKFRLLLSKKSPKPRESDKLKNLSQLEPLSKKTAPNHLKTYFKFIMKVLRKIILGLKIAKRKNALNPGIIVSKAIGSLIENLLCLG